MANSFLWPSVDAVPPPLPEQGSAISSDPLLLSIRILVGGVLLTAAVLKSSSPMTSVAIASTYEISPAVIVAIVQVELLLATLLLVGCWTVRLLKLSAGLFLSFAFFATYHALIGEQSCGCFGSVPVNPWVMSIIDAVLVCITVWAGWARGSERNGVGPLRLACAGALYFLVGTLSFAAVIEDLPSDQTAGQVFTSNGGSLVMLKPHDWVGKKFPLIQHVSPELDLQRGRWIVLIFHHDCPRCQEALPKYIRLYESFVTMGSGQRIVLLETPPYGHRAAPNAENIFARLKDSHEWFLQTPVEIQIDEGIVVGTSRKLPSISL